MKYSALFISSCLAAFSAQADVVQFSLGGAASGLSPANQVPAVTGEGSGGEIFGGITFDTDTLELNISVGYGSTAEFGNLSGPATAAHIHGPAAVGENAGPIHNFFTAGQHLAAGHPENGGIILGSVVLTADQATELLAGLYYINVHTANNPGGEIRGQLIPELNNAPTVTCPEAVVAECASQDGTPVSLTASVADADGDALVVEWTVDGTVYQTDEVTGSGDVEFSGLFGLGEHSVSVSVNDGTAEAVVCETTVTIQDTLPPEVTAVTPSQEILWPPNHKMVPVTISVLATDQCGPVSSRITSVTSDEPVNGKGDGNTSPDWMVTGDLTLDLRAERAGGGDGRVYTITIETVDESGHSVVSTTEVRVPHDMGRDISTPESPDKASKSKRAQSAGKFRLSTAPRLVQ